MSNDERHNEIAMRCCRIIDYVEHSNIPHEYACEILSLVGALPQFVIERDAAVQKLADLGYSL